MDIIVLCVPGPNKSNTPFLAMDMVDGAFSTQRQTFGVQRVLCAGEPCSLTQMVAVLRGIIPSVGGNDEELKESCMSPLQPSQRIDSLFFRGVIRLRIYSPLARRLACMGLAQHLIMTALGIPTKTLSVV
jgi:hypothetical protein